MSMDELEHKKAVELEKVELEHKKAVELKRFSDKLKRAVEFSKKFAEDQKKKTCRGQKIFVPYYSCYLMCWRIYCIQKIFVIFFKLRKKFSRRCGGGTFCKTSWFTILEKIVKFISRFFLKRC